MVKRLVALAILANLTTSLGAYAQSSPNAETTSFAEKKEEARRLFESAVRDTDERKFDDACPKLERALNLLPDHLNTAIALAQCYEEDKKFVTARDRYVRAATVAARQEKQDVTKLNIINDGISSSTRRISYITVHIPGTVGSIEGVSVTLDGSAIESANYGAKIPVNQGKHEIRANAPKRLARTITLNVIADAQDIQVIIDTLEPDTQPAPKLDPAPPPPESMPPKQVEKTQVTKTDHARATDTRINGPLIPPKNKPRRKENETPNSHSLEGGVALILLGGGFIGGGSYLAKEAIAIERDAIKKSQYPLYAGFSAAGIITGAVGVITGIALVSRSGTKVENHERPKTPTPTAALHFGPGQVSIEGMW